MPTIELDAGPIDYSDTGGPGPVLVFCPGLLMNESQWRKVIPLLPGCRCIAVVLPLGGHRRPMRDDADLSQLGVARILADFLDALDLTDVTVVLNDWGGGQFVASDRRTERISRLALVSCEAIDNFPPKPARPAVALCRLPGGTRLFLRLLSCKAVRRSPRMWGAISKRGVPDDVQDDWFAPAASSREIRRDLKKFATGTPPRKTLLEWNSQLRRFTGPVLVVWASEDRMMPVEHARLLAASFPHSETAFIDDSWTLIPEDQPERLAATLEAFVGAAAEPAHGR